MRKSNKKLKTFEQFEEVEVMIDKKRLVELINMAKPILNEIAQIIQQEDDRTISIEMFNNVSSGIDTLDDLESMYK